MAGKRKSYKREEPESEVTEQPIIKKVFKPYIDTITKDTQARDVDPNKLPKKIMVRFIQNPMGERSNRYISKSRTQYDFNGGVPLPVTNPIDIVTFVLKAKKNPETWEIVN